jgi:23S rRNA (guanosine2251-2'-O)-methyltransferase
VAAEELVFGRRPVREVLLAGVPTRRLIIAEGRHPGLEELETLAAERGIATERVPKRELDRIARGATHQGVVAAVEPFHYRTLADVIEAGLAHGDPVVLADGVSDPQNVGALIRVVDAAGAAGLVLPERRAAQVTPAARKASAGAAEHVAIARVTNLTRALDEIKRAGMWVVGLADDGPQDLYEADLPTPLALAVGSEGRGLSRLVRERCDLVVRIEMFGRVSSLNVAQAAAVALFEWRRRERGRA